MTALRPRSTAARAGEERDALAAPVADPLWLLARQWQTRAFVADDAGTPVTVRLAHVSEPLELDGAPLSGPLEPLVEAEPPAAADTATRARLGTELLRRLRDAGLDAGALRRIRLALAAAHPLAPPPLAGRVPDGAALAATLDAGQPLPGVDAAVARDWLAWAKPQLGTGGAPRAWDAERLEYTFTLRTRELTLTAAAYDGSGLDWYSFDRSATALAQAAGTPVEVRPTPVTYAGMPRPRFWELEDGHVNLDLLAGTDAAHALLASFAHAYANDWFVVPLEVPPGATAISVLEVADTFGTTTQIPATAVLDGPGSRWRLWELSGGEPDGLRVHLPIAPVPLESAPVEEVLIARDELANLAWLIELVTRDPDGVAVDRRRRWLELRPPGDLAFDPAGRPTASSYRLGTDLPDNWYPLVATGEGRLALAALPLGATVVSDEGVQGTVVPHAPGTVLADEEASRTGSRLRRADRLLRTRAGRVVWRARLKGPGTGEASSGLRFDVLR
jgi:hypothetical protein